MRSEVDKQKCSDGSECAPLDVCPVAVSVTFSDGKKTLRGEEKRRNVSPGDSPAYSQACSGARRSEADRVSPTRENEDLLLHQYACSAAFLMPASARKSESTTRRRRRVTPRLSARKTTTVLAHLPRTALRFSRPVQVCSCHLESHHIYQRCVRK